MSRALVIGVGQTSFGHGRLPDLPGVASDVAHVRQYLSDRGFDVAASDPEHPPPVAEFKSTLQEFVSSTPPGTLAVIYLAGHGFRARDDAHDEADGWDECFVCADTALRDDWFRDVLWSDPPPARFVVVVDACHSDTITLGLRSAGSRPAIVLRKTQPPDENKLYRLVLSACRDEQETYELAPSDYGSGVATRQMLETLQRAPQLTYEQLWPRVASNIRDLYPSSFPSEPGLSYLAPDDALLWSVAFTPS